ncbi:4-demethylwyosine synthase TYW1 [Methanonatronarchaeum sp. AMET-Sl]|uniref:4-demethylwyosine synthase TYW1 n=1 Tax=Methanonatronarchaeum sp. AMET-Sl TaxID=3037654 RepID=UPI00244DF9CF|nr:4-demethylwyosine synthase TYW1 [Methanonatronarchaeum sp. AMET-Sl]WGI17710.1 4-demethylwyosine synthase TYW1 [Methanonatronarchaeum sp. AMET-Sl]
MIPNKIQDKLQDQGYRLVGRHSAVKLCHWLKESLQNKPGCYKQRFYGIESHRCLQMTPTVVYCNQKCVFCWRSYEHWTKTKLPTYDPPQKIYQQTIQAQKQLLTGFGGSPEKYQKELIKEARQPKHLAISLSGEPTLYPKINQLIEHAHQQNMTTFLVTNGQQPKTIKNLTPPTQLYISLDAANKKQYQKICRPTHKNGWQKLQQTLKTLPKINGRTAIRITLINNLNDQPQQYIKLLNKAKPDYIEIKAYMHVGYSRKRLNRNRMPSNQQIKNFSNKITDKTDYQLENHVPESRVTLLTKDKDPELNT